MRVPPKLKRWLLGPNSDPSVRARFLTEVEGRPVSDPEVRAAVREIGRTGWAANLLGHQFPDGHWVTRGTSEQELYRPKYIVTNWIAIVLADLGMTRADPRIRRTAELIMKRWGYPKGDLSGKVGEVCVTGNAVRTLIRFGYLDHPVVQRSIGRLVRTQKADGGWHCFDSRTGTLDSWEGLAALAEIPVDQRSAGIQRSIERGAEFFLKRHLMDQGPEYPPWKRIHYPTHYYYDVLVGLRILSRLGYARDPRMARAYRWLLSKRARDGTWALDEAHPDLDPKHGGYRLAFVVYPIELELLHEPSRWATVEALSALARREDAG
jgi:hypothetical protein